MLKKIAVLLSPFCFYACTPAGPQAAAEATAAAHAKESAKPTPEPEKDGGETIVPLCAMDSAFSNLDDMSNAPSSNNWIYNTGSFGDTLYEAGGTMPGSFYKWNVRRKTAANGAWVNIMDDSYDPGYSSDATQVIADSKGRIIFSGWGSNASGYHGIVRYTDNGASWVTVADYTDAAFPSGVMPAAIAVDSNDNIIWALSGYKAGGAIVTIIRKGARQGDGSYVWSTIDSYNPATYTVTYLTAMTLVNDGIYYIAATDIGGKYQNEVRMSLDGGLSWTSNGAFDGSTSEGAYLSAISVDDSGNVFAVGYETRAAKSVWVLRKSVDHGATYTSNFWDPTVADSSNISNGVAVSLDQKNIYWSGVEVVAGSGHSVVLVSSDMGSTWSKVDDYVSPYGVNPYVFFNLRRQERGDIVLSGYLTLPDNSWRGATRILKCN